MSEEPVDGGDAPEVPEIMWPADMVRDDDGGRVHVYRGEVTDLDVQRALAGEVEAGRVQHVDPNVIYVVMLDESMQPSVGGTRDWLSYHSQFHPTELPLRYVVVRGGLDRAPRACVTTASRSRSGATSPTTCGRWTRWRSSWAGRCRRSSPRRGTSASATSWPATDAPRVHRIASSRTTSSSGSSRDGSCSTPA